MSSVMPLPIDTSRPMDTLPRERLSVADPADASTASARLALSRERLRREMRERSAPKRQAAVEGGARDRFSWQDRVKAIPVAGVLFETLASWWANHPLNGVGTIAAGAARASLAPMAQRNPLGLMVAAVVIGAAMVASRPWRWLLKPALFAGLVPQLVSKLVAHVPFESWMGIVSNFSKPKPRAPRDDV